MAFRDRKPEGELLQYAKWRGNTVMNDAHTLQKKGIKSPDGSKLYAKAIHTGMKCEIWFNSPERLQAFKNTRIDADEFKIVVYGL